MSSEQEQAVFNLSNLQAEFLQSTARFCCAITGIGVGKTLMLLLKAWKHCEQHKGALCLVIRKEFTDLEDSTIRDFSSYFGVKLDAKKNYMFPNGSVMMFRHGNENDLSVLKNINLSFIAIEQGEEYGNDNVFMWCRDRLRRRGTQVNQIAMICNSNGMDWVYDLFIAKAEIVRDYSVDKVILGRTVNTEEIYYKRIVQMGDEIQTYECWTANSWLNAENLPKETLVDWMSMENDAPNHFRRMVLNRFDAFDDTDMVFTSDDIQTALRTEFLYNHDLYTGRIMGVDVARGGDDCVMVILDQMGPNHWEETYFEKWKHRDTSYSMGRILAFRAEHKPNILVVDGDGMGGPMIDQMVSNGLDIVEYRGGMTKTLKEPTRYSNQRTEDTFFMKQLIESNRLKIKPDVVPDMQMIKFKWDSAGGKKMLVSKEKMSRSPDHFDALMMASSMVNDPAVYEKQRMSKQPRTAKQINPFAGFR